MIVVLAWICVDGFKEDWEKGHFFRDFHHPHPILIPAKALEKSSISIYIYAFPLTILIFLPESFILFGGDGWVIQPSDNSAILQGDEHPELTQLC